MKYLALLTSLLFISTAAQAVEIWRNLPVVCSEIGTPERMVINKYQESVVAQGMTHDGNLFRMFRAESGTFTIFLTTRSGETCLIFAGKQSVVEPPAKSGRPM